MKNLLILAFIFMSSFAYGQDVHVFEKDENVVIVKAVSSDTTWIPKRSFRFDINSGYIYLTDFEYRQTTTVLQSLLKGEAGAAIVGTIEDYLSPFVGFSGATGTVAGIFQNNNAQTRVEVINLSDGTTTRPAGTEFEIEDNGDVDISGNLLIGDKTLSSTPGAISYSSEQGGTILIRGEFTNSSINAGQESVVYVINNTGATISDGQVVFISGFNVANDAFEIELARADNIDDTEGLGVATTTILDTNTGLITIFGRVNDVNTSSFTAGDIVYLSPTVLGGITTTKPPIPIQIGHIGKVDASVGFIQVEIRELERSIYGDFSHTLDQTFTANVTDTIFFDTNKQVSGITHSETVDNSEFTFPNSGVYQLTIEPQYTRTSGGGTDVMNIFLSVDSGSGFVIIDDSNVKFAVTTSGSQHVSPLTATIRLGTGDKLRFMIQVEDANLILDAFASSGTGANIIPVTPSVIMNIVRIGD